jgi:two-component system sensor histidine kinase/response regulator
MTQRLRLLANRDPVVLIVDDQEPNIRLLGTVLSNAGFDVVPALNGEAALELARVSEPDLVLLDLVMPAMDGVEVCRRLRADPVTASLPVIILTAHHEREPLVRAFDAGAVDYVTKPFVPEELLARVRTHIELKLARDDLKRVARERAQLSELVAHDLKNPLSSIRFSAQMLDHSAEDPERVRRLSELIIESSERGIALIQRFLEDRRDEELRRSLTLDSIDLAEIAQTVARHMAVQAESKALQLELKCEPGTFAHADGDALISVVENLLSNAIKYSPRGAAISLQCGPGTPGMVRLVVADRGPGVPETEQARLFQRFVRLSTRPTAQESSSGLGLALAKRDAQQMGGDLHYEDRPGGGAVFVLQLAAAP